MLTREEIAEIVQYCKEKGVSYKSRLKEIGIAEWRFYESKRRDAAMIQAIIQASSSHV